MTYCFYDDQSQQLLHTLLICYHTLEVHLVRYSYATLTLRKRYQYVQSAGHTFVIRWNTLLHAARTLRVS